MRILLTFIFYFIPAWIFSQSLSVQELWQYLDKSYGQKQKDKEVLLRKAELEEERNLRLPVIYGDANVQRNLIIPVTPVPAIAFDPNAAEGAIIPLKFSTAWSSKAGVQVEWKVFDPKRRLSMREKELEVRKVEVEKEEDAQDWRFGATLAYASVVLATLQYEQAQQDSITYAEILTLVKSRYDAGRESSSNYYDALQEMERKQIKLHQSWTVLLDADAELRRYVDLSETLYLTTSVQGIYDFVRNVRRERYKIKELQVDKELSLMRSRVLKKERIPVLTLNGYLGGQYYGKELRLDRKDDWYGNSFVNMALRVPISTYFSNKPTFRQIQLNTLIYESQIQEEQRLQEISDQQRELKIVSIQKEIQSLRNILALAKESMESQEQSYGQGRLLLSDLNKSLLNYNKANLDVLQAEFDRIALILE